MKQVAETGEAFLAEHTAKLVEGIVAHENVGRMAAQRVKEPGGTER